MKYYILLLSLILSLTSFAQTIEKGGKTYDVKKEKIFLEGIDVTETLNLEEKQAIFKEASLISEKLKLEKLAKKEEEKANKASKKLEKDTKKAKKSQKKAEKAQKRAENELKKKEKLQSNFEKAQRNLKKGQEKYEKLKKRGKLSPVDDIKWLKKLETLSEKLKKAKGKL